MVEEGRGGEVVELQTFFWYTSTFPSPEQGHFGYLNGRGGGTLRNDLHVWACYKV